MKDVIYLQSMQALQRGHEVMDLATGELIRVTRFDKCMMTRLVINRVEQLAAQQGYKTLKFFNRKKEEMFLEDIDLLSGLQEVREHVLEEDDINLPSDNGVLSGPDEPLVVDEQINEEEVADLLQDAKENITNQPEVVEGEQNQINDDDFSLEGNEDEENPENCEDIIDVPDKEPQDIEDVPPLMSEGEHLDEDSDDEDDGNRQRSARPSQNAGVPERYNPETGRSYAQRKVCHNIVAQKISLDNTLQYN